MCVDTKRKLFKHPKVLKQPEAVISGTTVTGGFSFLGFEKIQTNIQM